MSEKKVYKQRKRKDFAVWVPDKTGEVRRKLERMAEGAMDGLGPIVRDLIIEADETAPKYQKKARLLNGRPEARDASGC